MNFKQYLKEQKEKDNEDKIMGSIIQFFSTHESPTDKEVHELAEDLELDKEKFEAMIYELLSSFLSKGLRNKVRPEQLEVRDDDILNKAIEIELEHTTDTPNGRALARLIVMDHVAEHGWAYYDELIKMEEKLKKHNK